MSVDNRRNPKVRASTTGPVVDWFANVVRTDTVTPVDPTAGPAAQSGRAEREPATGLLGAIERLIQRYHRLPSWVLIPQIFLAFAWGRAALAHLLTPEWWSGQEVLDFLATETGLRVDAYRYVLTGLVEPLPAVTAVVVVLTEVVIAVMLLLNHRATLAIGIAAFLNVQFILAGVVNPSVFYLVAALGIAIWRVETTATAHTLQRLTSATMMAGIIAIAFLAPGVRTLTPDGVLDDPALVLIFLALLTMVAMWWVNRRVALADQTLADLTGDTQLAPYNPPPPEVSKLGIGLSLLAAAVILVGGFTLLNDDDDPAETAAEPAAQEPGTLGAFDTPYPYGLNVTLSYNDLEFDESREWRVQILESVLDGNPIKSDPATDGQLARARVRLSYQDGSSAGPVDDIRFDAVGRSGTVYSAKTEGCGEPSGRLNGDEIEIGDAIEGWICWPVANEELSTLVMAVEAEPADGVLYMALQEAIDG